ncbi:hypothetical protein AHAS_Ahas02G0154000 [Arachis hypogaea]
MTLATFLKVNPPKFKGTPVATEADNWFRCIEKSLRVQHVPERQHVEFATYMLEGEAEHCGRIYCRFSKICQGNPDDFEEWKCLKYEGELREELMHSLVPLEIRNFAELVNKIQLVEDCTKKVAAAKMSCQELPPKNFNRQGRDTGKRP